MSEQFQIKTPFLIIEHCHENDIENAMNQIVDYMRLESRSLIHNILAIEIQKKQDYTIKIFIKAGTHTIAFTKTAQKQECIDTLMKFYHSQIIDMTSFEISTQSKVFESSLQYATLLNKIYKEMMSPDYQSLYYRLKDIYKTQEFQAVMDQEDFQNEFGAILFQTPYLTDNTYKYIENLFRTSLHQSQNNLYIYLNQPKKPKEKKWYTKLFEAIFVVFPAFCLFEFLRWKLYILFFSFLMVLCIYLLLWIYVLKKNKSTRFVEVVRNIIYMVLFILLLMGGDIGKQMKSESVDVQIIDSQYIDYKENVDVKVDESFLYINRLDKNEVEVIDQDFKQIQSYSINHDYSILSDFMVHNQKLYYTVFQSDCFKIYCQNKLIYEEKITSDNIYMHHEFIENNQSFYLVITLLDNTMMVYDMENQCYLRSVKCEYGIEDKKIVLMNNRIYFLSLDRYHLMCYDIQTESIMEVIQSKNINQKIVDFIVGENHIIVDSNKDNAFTIFENEKEEQVSLNLIDTHFDEIELYDDNKLLLWKDNHLSVYHLDKGEFIGRVDVENIQRMVNQCYCVGDYLLIRDDQGYKVLKIKMIES